MYTKWTTHCSNEHEKAQFEADLRRAKPVLDRLKVILEQMGKEVEAESFDFTSLAFPYVQAKAIGAKIVLADITKLIDLDKQKDTKNEHSTG